MSSLSMRAGGDDAPDVLQSTLPRLAVYTGDHCNGVILTEMFSPHRRPVQYVVDNASARCRVVQ